MASRPPLQRAGDDVVAAVDPRTADRCALSQPWLGYWARERTSADHDRLLTMVCHRETGGDGEAFVLSDQNTEQDIESSWTLQQALVIAYNGVPHGRLQFDEATHRQASYLSGDAWERVDDGIVLGDAVPGWKRQWGAYVIRLFAHPRVFAALVRERIHDRDPAPALVDLGEAASRLPLRNPNAPLPPRPV